MKIDVVTLAKIYQELFPLLFLTAVIIFLVMLINQLIRLIKVCFKNCKLLGPSGLLYGLKGLEAYEIISEHVTSVEKVADFSYLVKTLRGKKERTYQVFASLSDVGNQAYDQAVAKSAGLSEYYKHQRLPIGRVKNIFLAKNDETGKIVECILAYVKTDDEDTIEIVLNNFFEKRFENACKKSEKFHSTYPA